MRDVFVILAVLLWGANAAVADVACTMHVGWWIYPDQKGDVWLQEQHCGNVKYWQLMERNNNKILVQIPVPLLPKGHRFNYGQCTLKGELRNDIITIVRHDQDTEWSTEVFQAWLLDPIGKAITPIPAKWLSCRYEGYGL